MKTRSSLEKNNISRNLYERFRDFVVERGLIEPGEKVTAAVSGGADSVCMLLLLDRLRSELDFTLLACYVEHGIRGGASVEDGEFVKALSEKLGIPCRFFSVDVPARVKATGESTEEAARKLRYEALQSTDFDRLAIAHHLEDQCETLLFRMLRGTGPKGMCGMQPQNGKIIRPLLEFSKEEILAFLEENGQDYRTDATNLDLSYDRNRIRAKVLPELREMNEAAYLHIGSLAEQMAGLVDYVEGMADEYIESHTSDEGILLTDELLTQPKAFGMEVLRRFTAAATDHQKDITAEHYERMYALAASVTGRSMNLPAGWTVSKTYGGLLFLDKSGIRRTLDKKTVLRTRIFEYDHSVKIPTETYTKWVDCDKIAEDVCLRTRRTGDYIVLDDEGHRKSLKDWMIDHKIPRDIRDTIPVVTSGSEVLWIVGYRIGARCRVSDSTQKIMELNVSMEE